MQPGRRAVVLGMAAAAVPAIASAATPETYAEIPGPLLLEGIAHDGRRLYLGGIASRNILTLDRGGRTSVLPTGPLMGVFGMVVDVPRNRLWAATADLLDRSALVEIDLTHGHIIARYAAGPLGTTFGDVALGPDGSVFVSDSKGSIFRLARGGRAVEVFLPRGKLKSPQGMVVRGGKLIVADYSSGLHRVDLATGGVSFIDGAPIRGIDGLVAHRSDLIAIQNGGSVPRVLRITLPAGEQPGAEILYEGAVLIEPSLGTIIGNRLFFIGRSQWGEADARGQVKAGAGPTRIMSLALG